MKAPNTLVLTFATALGPLLAFADDSQPSVVEFALRHGALILNVLHNDGKQNFSLRIEGPRNPHNDSMGKIVKVFEKQQVELDTDAILELLSHRVAASEKLSESESAFWAAAVLHSTGRMRIKRWGVSGCNHLRKGEWMELFRVPKSDGAY